MTEMYHHWSQVHLLVGREMTTVLTTKQLGHTTWTLCRASHTLDSLNMVHCFMISQSSLSCVWQHWVTEDRTVVNHDWHLLTVAGQPIFTCNRTEPLCPTCGFLYVCSLLLTTMVPSKRSSGPRQRRFTGPVGVRHWTTLPVCFPQTTLPAMTVWPLNNSPLQPPSQLLSVGCEIQDTQAHGCCMVIISCHIPSNEWRRTDPAPSRVTHSTWKQPMRGKDVW